MRSPALMSICSKTGCHAVLAPLSGCYPPLEGRSPTCYSPVRHSVTPCGATAFDLHVLGTPPALILSQDQTLMLKRFIRLRRLRGYGETILITRAPVDIWLCVVLLLSEYPRARESKPPAPCWLILDGFVRLRALQRFGETVLARPIQFSKNRPGPEGPRPSQTRTRLAWQALTSQLSTEFRGTF